MNPVPDRAAVEHPTGRSEGAAALRPTIAPAYALALLACTAFALWLVWPAFEPGRLMNLDAPRHLLRAQVMAGQFLPSGHVDGWSPWWYLGAQIFLFQSYGWFFVIGATAVLAGTPAHLGAVFKFWYVVPLVLLPAATARLARRLGVSAAGAVVAAIASLAFSSPLGYGRGGLFGVGLLLQAVGVVGFALAWPSVLDTLLDRGRAPWPAVLLLAAVLLAHFISGAYALAAAGLAAAYFAWRSRRAQPLLRYALVAGLVLLLAGHTLFPSLELRALAGTGVGWGSERDRLARLLAGTLFGGQPLALAGLAAAAWSLWRGSPRLAATALLLFVTAVLGGSDEQVWEPSALADVLRVYVRPRALPYAALLQAVFAGVAADIVVRCARGAIEQTGGRRWSWVVLPVALAVVLGVAVPEAARHRGRVVTESQLKPRERRVYTNLVMWLRRNVKRPAIVAVPRTLLPRSILGARSVISLLNLDTGLYALGGDQAELTKAGRRADRINLDRLPRGTRRTAELLRKAGVSHVIVSLPSVRQLLSASDDFELVYEDAGRVSRRESRLKSRRESRGSGSVKKEKPVGVAVYRLKRGGRWLHADGLKVRAMHHAPERTTWEVRVVGGPQPRQAVTAINWHPNWTATVDGRRVPTSRSPGARVALDVPADAARVTLEFVRSAREKAWIAMSAATLALVLALQARHALRVRRRREPRRGT